MKQILFLTLTMLTLCSCDAPMRNRTPGQFQNMNGLNNGDGANNNAISYNPGDLINNATGTTTGGSTGANDVNFPSCDLTAKYHTTSIGYFGLCQGTNDSQIKIKFSMTTTSSRNCLIPTYKDANGSSTYIGQPQCTYVNQANAEIQGSLPKNRSGFESYALNGVMVMKEELLPYYFKCMHAYIDWLGQLCPNGPQSSQQCYITYSSCPYGARSNANCDQSARQYMTNVCNSFKSTYSNQYVDIRTK